MADAPAPDRLTAIREREQQATTEPWTFAEDYAGAEEHVVFVDDHLPGRCVVASGLQQGGGGFADAEFIAHAREDIPYLLAEVDRLSRLLSDEKLKVEGLHKHCDIYEADIQRMSRLLGAQPEPPALLDALRTYGQHQTGCRKSQCKTCGCSLVGGDHEDSYNGHTSWHPFVWGDCTCGLDAALASPRVREGETP